MRILGVKVDAVSKKEALLRLSAFLDAPTQHFITTPNPEIILHASRRPEYRDVLNKADLALPDGAGLLLASIMIGQPLKERVSGSDMVPEICYLARERGLKVALLGGRDKIAAEKAAAAMREWGNEIVYASHGVPKNEWDDKAKHDKILDELRAAGPALVFVGFGHPKQEIWIDEYRSRLPSVRLFLGCGGALDFISGSISRAPGIMRKLGLEWLWRLVLEPKRWKRILNAVIVFPLTVIARSLKKN